MDFSERNKTAIKVAVQLARQNRGRIILIHVIENIEQISDSEMQEFYAKLEANAEKRFIAFSKSVARSKVPVERVIVQGRRANELVKYAMASRCDLIVMSSHRVTSDEGWSSLSYRMALLSPCPVLLVK